MTETAGVDFSGTRPDPVVAARAGYRFGVSYLKPAEARSVYEWRPGELAAWRAAGHAVGAVYEWYPERAREGAGAGDIDGHTARERAAVVGYPGGCVCFFAVDEDVPEGDLPAVAAYLAEAAKGWGGPAGVYGGWAVIDYCARNLPNLWRWQTGAWAYRRPAGAPALHPAAHLYQRTAPSGRWPVLPGTDENVLIDPSLPLWGATEGVETMANSDDILSEVRLLRSLLVGTRPTPDPAGDRLGDLWLELERIVSLVSQALAIVAKLPAVATGQSTPEDVAAEAQAVLDALTARLTAGRP